MQHQIWLEQKGKDHRLKKNLFFLTFITIFSLFGSGSTCLGSRDVQEGKVEPSPEQQNLQKIEEVVIPIYDAYATAFKYKNISIDPDEPAHTKIDYTVGDSREFFVLDSITNQYSTAEADLVYITPHLYFWIQDGVEYEMEDVEKLCETFENQIYPLNREFFGSEDTPGIDEDEHLFILYNNQMNGAAGYFSSADTFPREIEPYSNEAEIFMLSAVSARLGQEYTYSILAHEFQHMIHQNLDSNESTWVNEGFSELAMWLNGYGTGGSDWLYARDPDIQLDFWPRDEVESTLPHYGASFLFMTYLYDRFGENFSKALVSNPLDGFTAIDAELSKLTEDNPAERPLNSDDVFQDWTVANLLQDHSLGEGEFGYSDFPDLSSFRVDGAIDCENMTENSYTVRQYGVDYFDVDCEQPFTLQFTGQQTVPVIPADPHSGEYYFWSNKGDQSAMTLTQTFDFTDAEGPIFLKYYTWYDLETDWDYVYLLASEDGESWEQLKPDHCTEENITGSNQGCGYNGTSDGWVQEVVDLSQYAGKKVTLQFEYLTDSSLNGEGFVLDDMSIENISYQTDFETDDGGWKAEGFVRIINILPQTYRITMIEKNGEQTRISRMTVQGDEVLNLEMNPQENDEIYLIVSGTTRFTEVPAEYSLRILNQTGNE